jgi:hypothetical protein
MLCDEMEEIMSTVLFNPSNELFETQYVGETVAIQPYPDPGHMLKVDDARARHVLNVLGPRGLTTLDYGDSDEDKEAKAKSGRERNKAFKRKQVIEFNQLNQGNEQRKLPYIVPTKQLAGYADELGITLLQPYSHPDEGREKVSGLLNEVKEKDTLIKEQGKQISDLGSQVSTLSGQVSQLLKAFQQPDKPQKEKVAWVEPVEGGDGGILIDKEMLKFRTLNTPQLMGWLKKNWDNIPKYPEEIRSEIEARHEKLFGIPLPDDLPE